MKWINGGKDVGHVLVCADKIFLREQSQHPIQHQNTSNDRLQPKSRSSKAVEQQDLDQDHRLHENTKIALLLHLSLEWRGVGPAGP